MTEAQKVPRRDEVPVKDTWDLTKIYADTAAWEQDVARLEGLLPEVAALQGTIGQGADKLLQALTLRDEVFNILYSLYVYASHRKDSDSTDPAGQARFKPYYRWEDMHIDGGDEVFASLKSRRGSIFPGRAVGG